MTDNFSPLGEQQEKELKAIMENEKLLEFMEAHLSNHGEEEKDVVILERQAHAIQAFAELGQDFWSLEFVSGL